MRTHKKSLKSLRAYLGFILWAANAPFLLILRCQNSRVTEGYAPVLPPCLIKKWTIFAIKNNSQTRSKIPMPLIFLFLPDPTHTGAAILRYS